MLGIGCECWCMGGGGLLRAAAISGNGVRHWRALISCTHVHLSRAPATACREGKGIYVFYLELLTDMLHLFVYVMFFIIVFTHYGLPLHLVRACVCCAREGHTHTGAGVGGDVHCGLPLARNPGSCGAVRQLCLAEASSALAPVLSPFTISKLVHAPAPTLFPNRSATSTSPSATSGTASPTSCASAKSPRAWTASQTPQPRTWRAAMASASSAARRCTRVGWAMWGAVGLCTAHGLCWPPAPGFAAAAAAAARCLSLQNVLCSRPQ